MFVKGSGEDFSSPYSHKSRKRNQAISIGQLRRSVRLGHNNYTIWELIDKVGRARALESKPSDFVGTSTPFIPLNVSNHVVLPVDNSLLNSNVELCAAETHILMVPNSPVRSCSSQLSDSSLGLALLFLLVCSL